MTLRILDGDITHVNHGIIGHVVNNRAAMGAGVALALYKRWPDVRSGYMNWWPQIGVVPSAGHFPTPNTQFLHVADEVIVANMCCQDGFGGGHDHMDYFELARAIQQVAVQSRAFELPVFFPYGMGAGLAGGDWSCVTKIIEAHCPDATLVRLTKER